MKSLRNFKHVNTSTVDEAVSILRQHGDKACVISGGTQGVDVQQVQGTDSRGYDQESDISL